MRVTCCEKKANLLYLFYKSRGQHWRINYHFEDLDYVKDLVLLTLNKDDMQEKIDVLAPTELSYRLRINAKRTKVSTIMTFSNPILALNNTLIQHGNILNPDSGAMEDVD